MNLRLWVANLYDRAEGDGIPDHPHGDRVFLLVHYFLLVLVAALLFCVGMCGETDPSATVPSAPGAGAMHP